MVLAPRGQIAVVDPATVIIRGYAAIFGNQFNWFDPFEWRARTFVIEPGAFTSVLERLGGRPLEVYWRHEDWALQLGETTVLRQDDQGLYFEARPFATDPALDILTVIDGRTRTGASMSFEFGEIVEDEDGIEHLHSFSDLYEVGPCPVGANPLAFAELVEVGEASEETEPEPAPAVPDSDITSDAADAALAATLWRATAQLRRHF